MLSSCICDSLLSEKVSESRFEGALYLLLSALSFINREDLRPTEEASIVCKMRALDLETFKF